MSIDRKKLGKEIWRDCCGKWFGIYMVSSHGRIRNKAKGIGRRGERILFQSKDNKGYSQVYLYFKSKQHTTKVHRLVSESFLGVKPEKYQVDHVDCNKDNNNVSNLEYVSVKENMQRASRNGLRPKTHRPYSKKINFEIAQHIREQVKKGIPRKVLASKYDLHVMTIGEIVRGEIWKRSEKKTLKQ